MKLYPPYLEGSIPAFFKNNDTDKGTVITVPFAMNKAVSKSAVAKMWLKIKTVQSGTFLGTVSTVNFDVSNKFEAYFTLPETIVELLHIGLFYKVLIAYEDLEGGEGYYSTVATVKFTTAPVITIENISTSDINIHLYSYIGKYVQASYTYNEVSLTENTYLPNAYYFAKTDTDYVLDNSLYFINNRTYYEREVITDITASTYKDITEKEYSYEFCLYDNNLLLIYTSGELIHNTYADVEYYESTDEYSFISDLEENKMYYLLYKVTTINGLVAKSPLYRLMLQASIEPTINAELTATLNYDNGYIDINLKSLDNNGASGAFMLTRACEDDNYLVWHELYRFIFHHTVPNQFLYRDYTIEQGKHYIYALLQYNNYGVYSSRISTYAIEADFEDAFLYDGEKLLRIRYNPKVTSFKNDLLESKVDTIGSKYPFIFRNGTVQYKEFPLSGLISYLMDTEHLFLSEDDLNLNSKFLSKKRAGTVLNEKYSSEDEEYFKLLSLTANGLSDNDVGNIRLNYKNHEQDDDILVSANLPTTNLVGYNIAAERIFKLAVLEWLNNGEPKLFRSPGEGNYLVRLLNVSLSPEDKLSRMLHSFSSTAYEIDLHDFNTLLNYGIVNVADPYDFLTLLWETIYLPNLSNVSYITSEISNKKDKNNNAIGYELLLNSEYIITNVKLEGMIPGTIFLLNGEEIEIGNTGAYEVYKPDGIESLILPVGTPTIQGSIILGYYGPADTTFNNIKLITLQEYPAQQFIGEMDDIITTFNNCKRTMLNFYYLFMRKRTIAKIIERLNNVYYRIGSDIAINIPNDVASPILWLDSAGTRRIWLTGHYPDPFELYSYEKKYLTINGENYYGYSLSSVDNARDFDLIKTNLYIRSNDRGIYTLLTNTAIYDSDTLYYERKPFICIYDPNNKNIRYMLPESYNKLANDVITRIGLTRWLEITNIKEYNNIITIGLGNQEPIDFDLTELEHYEINGPIKITYLSCGCGIVLETGYLMRNIVYDIEEKNGNLSALYKTFYKYNSILSTNTRDEYCKSVNNDRENWNYIEQLKIARNNYILSYDNYIAAVELVYQSEILSKGESLI